MVAVSPNPPPPPHPPIFFSFSSTILLQISNRKEATWQSSAVLCELLWLSQTPLLLSTCVATKLHTRSEQSIVIRLRQHILALAVGCSVVLQCTVSIERLGAISSHLCVTQRLTPSNESVNGAAWLLIPTAFTRF